MLVPNRDLYAVNILNVVNTIIVLNNTIIVIVSKSRLTGSISGENKYSIINAIIANIISITHLRLYMVSIKSSFRPITTNKNITFNTPNTAAMNKINII